MVMMLREETPFGVWYTCYKEREAIEYSLDVLYSIYPDCPVYLFSDGGYDYSYLEKKYKFLKTSLEDDSRGWCQQMTSEQILNFRNSDLQQKLYYSAYTWMERQKKAIDYCQTPFLLTMEPDVLVRGKLNIPQDAILLGSRVNEGLSDDLRAILTNIDGAIDVNNWGWPLVYSTEAFNEAWNFITNNDDIFKRFVYSDYRFGSGGDITVPVLFGACGFREEVNSDLIECIRSPGWEHTNHPLVHQFRGKYPVSGSGYDGRHGDKQNIERDHDPDPV